MMDPKTGDLYPSIEEARRDILGNPKITEAEANLRVNDLVEITGTEKAVKSVSAAVKADRRRKDNHHKNKEARNSRKKNRK